MEIREIRHLGPVWILVAHESGARIFGRLNHRMPIELLEKIDHPVGRAKTRDLVSDRAGRESEWAPSAGRHAVGEKVQPTDTNAVEFARTLGLALDLARNLNRFEFLILIAGPRFLGMLRDAIPAATSNCIVGSLPLNLGNLEDAEIPAHLMPVVDDFYRTAGLKRPA